MTTFKWLDADTAPHNIPEPLAIALTIRCTCARGARTVITGFRHEGQWVIDFAHDCDITHYAVLERPPPAVAIKSYQTIKGTRH